VRFGSKPAVFPTEPQETTAQPETFQNGLKTAGKNAKTSKEIREKS
jgi:hypothetical protein